MKLVNLPTVNESRNELKQTNLLKFSINSAREIFSIFQGKLSNRMNTWRRIIKWLKKYTEKWQRHIQNWMIKYSEENHETEFHHFRVFITISRKLRTDRHFPSRVTGISHQTTNFLRRPTSQRSNMKIIKIFSPQCWHSMAWHLGHLTIYDECVHSSPPRSRHLFPSSRFVSIIRLTYCSS